MGTKTRRSQGLTEGVTTKQKDEAEEGSDALSSFLQSNAALSGTVPDEMAYRK